MLKLVKDIRSDYKPESLLHKHLHRYWFNSFLPQQITGCDTGIGHELARHLDGLGFHVFAGCLDTSSEGAQRLRVECSPFLRLVNMDVTRDDHVKHAIDYIVDNLPAGEQGRRRSVLKARTKFLCRPNIQYLGQWLWLSWQSGRWRYQRSPVRIQSSAKKKKQGMAHLKNIQI